MITKLFFLVSFLFISFITCAQNIAINEDGALPDNSAMLDIKSDAKGMLVPRMTLSQRTGITLPATGLLVYQTDGTTGFYYNSGTAAVPAWKQLGTEVWIRSAGSTSLNTTTDNVGIGTASPGGRLQVQGNISIPATSNYRYLTAKTKKYKVGVADMMSANPAYQARIDDGFSSATINGLNSLSASGGVAGTVAYFLAPLHLPDSAVITALAAQLIKNGGSLQSIVELYRTDGTGYLTNTAQLIATATTTGSGGGIAYVNASSVNASYNVIDNNNYFYFIRYSGEQNTQNIRFVNATITYQVYRPDY